jgi:hypothetical protein
MVGTVVDEAYSGELGRGRGCSGLACKRGYTVSLGMPVSNIKSTLDIHNCSSKISI